MICKAPELILYCIYVHFITYYRLLNSHFFKVYGIWTLPFFLCDVYIAMDVICSTASIFNLVAISVDR